MATYAVTITNPGGETGNTTGWTKLSGLGTMAVDTVAPRTGTYSLGMTRSCVYYNTVTIDPARHTMLDAGGLSLTVNMWCRYGNVGTSPGWMLVELLDASSNVLSSYTTTATANPTYTQHTIDGSVLPVWPGTRYIRINLAIFAPLGHNVYFDDVSAEFSDVVSPYARDHQQGTYALGTYPSDRVDGHTAALLGTFAAETSSGFHDVLSHQMGAYALVRPNAERQDLTAWTFKQDDHEFYVLQLNSNDTLIYDKLTGQWSDFVSPDYDHWRGTDGCNWEGIAVACDTRTGKLWQIDPEGRLDYGDTPIVSTIVGGMTERFRVHKPIYMAELAISNGDASTGTDGSLVGITLETGDGDGTWYNHGEIAGSLIGQEILVRWYGLGLYKAPGVVFRLTDTGYARRIDGLNIEVGGEASG